MLHGVTVLVTRPEHQAAPLCHLLEAQGAAVVRLPALQIEASQAGIDSLRRSGRLEHFDLMVFTSANAVRFAAGLLDPTLALNLAAVGPATARALAEAGFHGATTPTAGFDSEGLLAQPALAQAGLRRVLLIKGTGGRDVLQVELERRGAQVVVAEVYKRSPAAHAPGVIAAATDAFCAGAAQVVTATSAELAASLLHLASPALRGACDRAHWLIPSRRVAQALRDLGVGAPLLLARSAMDHDLLAAIERWRSSESGE